MTKKELERQKKEFLISAQKNGVNNNYLFTTTFKRYTVQLSVLDDLEKSFDEDGMLVEKEYVKGRKNLYSNPAVKEYNRTVDSANKTAALLVKIIKELGSANKEESEDPLLKLLNGADDE